jgi:hypothetical protein
MSNDTNVNQSASAPRLSVEFSGLGVFVLDRQKQALEILFIDARLAGIVPHEPVLMAPFDRFRFGPGSERPTVVTIGGTLVAIWDLTGRDLTCPAPPAPGMAGVTFPNRSTPTGPRPDPRDDPNAWNNLVWLPDLRAVCDATTIAHPELVTASASFTSGSMFVGKPPVSASGLFRFEGVPAVPDRLYSDRGGCVCPMDAATGVTLTLTSRTGQSMSSGLRFAPEGGDLHVAIANYPQMTMQMPAEHFVAYYELLGAKIRPPLVLIAGDDPPAVTCVPPTL